VGQRRTAVSWATTFQRTPYNLEASIDLDLDRPLDRAGREPENLVCEGEIAAGYTTRHLEISE